MQRVRMQLGQRAAQQPPPRFHAAAQRRGSTQGSSRRNRGRGGCRGKGHHSAPHVVCEGETDWDQRTNDSSDSGGAKRSGKGRAGEGDGRAAQRRTAQRSGPMSPALCVPQGGNGSGRQELRCTRRSRHDGPILDFHQCTLRGSAGPDDAMCVARSWRWLLVHLTSARLKV